mmetsp:Transcript_18395/g.42604  ORF Transcript_18395/g.42604 Transcript_18395/m.42604 type:complete len:191 (+) Transcript_18395:875-1447(+)
MHLSCSSFPSGLAKNCYRKIVQDKGVTDSPPPGWGILKLRKADAEAVFQEEMEVLEATKGSSETIIQTDMYGERYNEDGVPINADSREKYFTVKAIVDTYHGKEPLTGNSYICGNCGAIKHVPDSQDWETDYGDDYKCLECGAPGRRFKFFEGAPNKPPKKKKPKELPWWRAMSPQARLRVSNRKKGLDG